MWLSEVLLLLLPSRWLQRLMAVSLMAHALSAFDVFQETRHYEDK